MQWLKVVLNTLQSTINQSIIAIEIPAEITLFTYQSINQLIIAVDITAEITLLTYQSINQSIIDQSTNHRHIEISVEIIFSPINQSSINQSWQ